MRNKITRETTTKVLKYCKLRNCDAAGLLNRSDRTVSNWVTGQREPAMGELRYLVALSLMSIEQRDKLEMLWLEFNRPSAAAIANALGAPTATQVYAPLVVKPAGRPKKSKFSKPKLDDWYFASSVDDFFPLSSLQPYNPQPKPEQIFLQHWGVIKWATKKYHMFPSEAEALAYIAERDAL